MFKVLLNWLLLLYAANVSVTLRMQCYSEKRSCTCECKCLLARTSNGLYLASTLYTYTLCVMSMCLLHTHFCLSEYCFQLFVDIADFSLQSLLPMSPSWCRT